MKISRFSHLVLTLLLAVAAATTSTARADSLDQLGEGSLLGEARFASGPGNLLYLGAGTLLPLLEDGKDGKQHAARTADALLTSTLLATALKAITREQRPDGSGRTSFPSGHATAAFTVATMQAHYHPRQVLYWYGGAALIGESRVQLNRHYLDDVVAGAALGYFTARFELGRNRGLILRPFITRGDRRGGAATGLSFSKSF